MKHPVLALACILIAAPSGATAQDLNKLELGTHELSEMKTLSGVRLVFDPTKIIMAYALPRSSGRGMVTNIIGLAGGGPQEIDEPPASLLERLGLKPYFVALTLPDGVPVWVKTAAISFLRSIEPWDHIRVEAKTALSTGGRPIFVKESVAAIKDAIDTMRRQNKDSGESSGGGSSGSSASSGGAAATGSSAGNSSSTSTGPAARPDQTPVMH